MVRFLWSAQIACLAMLVLALRELAKWLQSCAEQVEHADQS